MARTGWITRGEDDDLQLFVPDEDPPALLPVEPCARYDFYPDGLDLGAPKVTYKTAESAAESGARLLAAVEGMATSGLRLFATGYDGDDLQDNIDELVTALKQFEFELWIQPDGVTVPYAWTLWRCEVAVGLSVQFWGGRVAPIVASTQRHPVPISGPAI